MSSISLTPDRFGSRNWLHRGIYYLATGFMFAAVALRSILLYQKSPLFSQTLLLLGAWLIFFVIGGLLPPRLTWLLAGLLGLEILVTLRLLVVTQADFFAFLFAVPSMQARQRYSMRVAVLLTGVTTLLGFAALYQPFGIFYALAIAVVYFGGTAFLVMYIGSTRRLRLIQDQQQELVTELQQANAKLESYSQQLQQRSAMQERQRLARELHDSVTQTIFSMTLTTQSALLLLERDRKQVAAQLNRLYELAQNALAEMQTLISKLAPEASGGFVSALRSHLAERRRLESLSVSLEVTGDRRLSDREEQNLFRIIQEALNNVVKHAGVERAAIRLRLDERPSLEVTDDGAGFEPEAARVPGRLGLMSMQERAEQIGWKLRVDSAPGKGTRVQVWKDAGGEVAL